MGKTIILIEEENGLVKSTIKNENANSIDFSVVLGEMELIKLQILSLIQKNRTSKTQE